MMERIMITDVEEKYYTMEMVGEKYPTWNFGLHEVRDVINKIIYLLKNEGSVSGTEIRGRLYTGKKWTQKRDDWYDVTCALRVLVEDRIIEMKRVGKKFPYSLTKKGRSLLK